MIHLCKASLAKPLTELEIQKMEEKRQQQLDRSKWTCPVCKIATDLFYKKLHYGRCFPEPKREFDTKICEDCGKSINSYYHSFHFPNCEKQLIKKVRVIKRRPEEPLAHINELRITGEYSSSNYTNDLSKFLRNKAVLEKGYWVLYRNNRRIGPVEKATKEVLTSWDPHLQKEEVDSQ
jgi:predicted RNA-binding Zn-ribbon protein involved in translation (DUF1610 family)